VQGRAPSWPNKEGRWLGVKSIRGESRKLEKEKKEKKGSPRATTLENNNRLRRILAKKNAGKGFEVSNLIGCPKRLHTQREKKGRKKCAPQKKNPRN